MAQVSNSQGVFTGINELHVVKGGFGDRFTLPTGVSAVEVPVAEVEAVARITELTVTPFVSTLTQQQATW